MSGQRHGEGRCDVTDIIQQIVGACCRHRHRARPAASAYFWGTNWLLDKFLASIAAMSGVEITRRDNLRRSQIRPWLFLAPGAAVPRRSISSTR